MFIELEELHVSENDKLEWRETARWVKYEEDVLEDTDRWGKPHIANLNFRSLLELHKCIDLGSVNLDMMETGLADICKAIVAGIVESGQLPESQTAAVLQALLLDHVHQCDPHPVPEEPSAHEEHKYMMHQQTRDHIGGYKKPALDRSTSLNNNLISRIAAKHKSHSVDYSNIEGSLLDSDASLTGIDEIGAVEKGLLSTIPNSPELSLRGAVDRMTTLSDTREVATAMTTTELSMPEIAVAFPQVTTLESSTGVDDRTASHGSPSSGERQPGRQSEGVLPGVLSGEKHSKAGNGIEQSPLTRESGSGVGTKADSQSVATATATTGRRTTLNLRKSHDLVRLRTASSSTLDTGINRLRISESDDEFTAVYPQSKSSRHFYESLPEDSEGTSVLVGALDFLQKPIVAFVRLSEGQQLKQFTEVPVPVRFIFCMIGPPVAGDRSKHCPYHEVGRSIATLMTDEAFQTAAYQAKGRQDLLEAINVFLDASIVLPPGKWDVDKDKNLLYSALQKQNSQGRDVIAQPELPLERDDPLAKTGKLFGGLMNDLRRVKHRYLSDLTDAKNKQVLFTAMFMYFAALAPVITFGGLLGKKTESVMGLSEMLIATSVGGMIFSMLTGQPLMLIGPTGPLLVFEEVIYEFCKDLDIPFLPFRFWSGVWIAVVLMVVVATDTSYLVKKFTRFTEEVFAALIAFIFIYESLKSIFLVFKNNPLRSEFCSLESCFARDNWTVNGSQSQCYAMPVASQSPMNEPNSALVYLLLVLGTYCLAYSLRILRNSQYLSKEIRRTLSDFGILITIITAVLVAHFVFGAVNTEKIAAVSFQTTNGRSWVADLSLSTGYIFAAIIPGLLVAFLVFVECQVTALIVGSPDHKLVKGDSFHWNLAIVAGLILVSSVLGLPWLVGTPVPSLSHTSSLLVYRQTRAPGERPVIEGAVEQRVSNFLIHFLLLLSLLVPQLVSLLQQIPVAVLFGVFLYLGCVSLLNLQLSHRIVLLLIPPKHHPDSAAYVREVKTRSMHLYTAFQLGCLLVLSIFKLTPASMAVPIILLLMLPLRSHIVTRFFSGRELLALDPHEVVAPPASVAEDKTVLT